MVGFFAAAAVSISLLGFRARPVLYLLIFVAGATTIGTQILLYAGTAQFYGMSIRSTGLGWASGISRNGAIVGPLLGGVDDRAAAAATQLHGVRDSRCRGGAGHAGLQQSRQRRLAAPKPAYAALTIQA